MKNRLIAVAIILILTGCNSENQKPLASYERPLASETFGFKFYENVIYNPVLKTDNILDLEFIDEANGYYLLSTPSQKLINKLISNGYILYQNEKGEIIVDV